MESTPMFERSMYESRLAEPVADEINFPGALEIRTGSPSVTRPSVDPAQKTAPVRFAEQPSARRHERRQGTDKLSRTQIATVRFP